MKIVFERKQFRTAIALMAQTCKDAKLTVEKDVVKLTTVSEDHVAAVAVICKKPSVKIEGVPKDMKPLYLDTKDYQTRVPNLGKNITIEWDQKKANVLTMSSGRIRVGLPLIADSEHAKIPVPNLAKENHNVITIKTKSLGEFFKIALSITDEMILTGDRKQLILKARDKQKKVDVRFPKKACLTLKIPDKTVEVCVKIDRIQDFLRFSEKATLMLKTKNPVFSSINLGPGMSAVQVLAPRIDEGE